MVDTSRYTIDGTEKRGYIVQRPSRPDGDLYMIDYLVHVPFGGRIAAGCGHYDEARRDAAVCWTEAEAEALLARYRAQEGR